MYIYHLYTSTLGLFIVVGARSRNDIFARVRDTDPYTARELYEKALARLPMAAFFV